MMKNEQTLSELDKLNASRKFIDDKNYTKKQKDAFVEFIRDCQKKEDIAIIDKFSFNYYDCEISYKGELGSFENWSIEEKKRLIDGIKGTDLQDKKQ